MLKIYKTILPELVSNVEIGGKCPFCGDSSRFTLKTHPLGPQLYNEGINEIILSYSCDACQRIIPIRWRIERWGQHAEPIVTNPLMILPVVEDFDFENVPEPIVDEISEALKCLSVEAYHGFASLCRRSIQAICNDLGANGSTKVQKQISEMLELMGLDTEWEEMTKQIMLTGHDGAHPQLPKVDLDRSMVLLSLLRDLTYQLYTRPGKVKKAAELRKKAAIKE